MADRLLNYCPRASRAAGQPIYTIESRNLFHRHLSPKQAYAEYIRQLEAPSQVEGKISLPQLAQSFPSQPKFLQYLCTQCTGEGSTRDPLIVGCDRYECALWEYRFGTNPAKKGVGKAKNLSQRTPH